MTGRMAEMALKAETGTRAVRILGAMVLVWAAVTARDIARRAESGFETDGNSAVIHVTPGSPAAAAGIKAGDYITAVNGIQSRDTAGLARLGRAEIGELRVLTIKRGNDLLELEIVPGPPAIKSLATGWLALLTGGVFLLATLRACLQHPARATRVLAVMGMGFSLVFLDGARFDSLFLQSLFAVTRSGLVLAGFAAMLHFLLVFPAPGAFASTPINIRVLYLPAFLFWMLLSYRAVWRPEGDSALNTLTYLITGLVIAGYGLASIIVFLRKYLKTPAPGRKEQGLTGMLWGSLLGFIPALLGYMPALSGVPGHEYFFVSLVLVPLTWSRATQRVLAA